MRVHFLSIIGVSAYFLMSWMVSGTVHRLGWADAAVLAIGLWAIRISVAMLMPRIVGTERTWRFQTLMWSPEMRDDRIVAVSPVADILQVSMFLLLLSAVTYPKAPFSLAGLMIETALFNVMMTMLQIVDWLYVRKHSRLQ